MVISNFLKYVIPYLIQLWFLIFMLIWFVLVKTKTSAGNKTGTFCSKESKRFYDNIVNGCYKFFLILSPNYIEKKMTWNMHEINNMLFWKNRIFSWQIKNKLNFFVWKPLTRGNITLPGSYMAGHVVKHFIMSCFVQCKDMIHYSLCHRYFNKKRFSVTIENEFWN